MANLSPVRSSLQVLAQHGSVLFSSLSAEGEPSQGRLET